MILSLFFLILPDLSLILLLSTTPSTSSRGPTKKILALMSLQLTKPIGYSFAVELCSGKNCQGKCSQGSLG